MDDYLKIVRNGLWNNNQALVALLGLCPLLAVTNNIVNAIGLGIATTFVLVASNTTVSIFRNYISKEVRIPIFVLLIASFVMKIHLLFMDLGNIFSLSFDNVRFVSSFVSLRAASFRFSFWFSFSCSRYS